MKKTGRDIYLELMNSDRYFIQVEPVIDNKMRGICTKAYPNHPKGCPNFGKKAGCPPESPQIDELIRTDHPMPVYAIFNRFDFRGHCERMKEKHPEWSQRQVECCLYWQGTARKVLKDKIKAFMWKFPHWDIVACPEGAGVNITETMKNVGIELEWPPVNYTYQIVLAGIPKGEFQYEL